eukprot:TRINITY_DN4142_c0_g2_i1.p1 TRINITY_DN4142_c0_g2~~TRINITY_DN4142_c0_g2_i1.p1  ORF type:complete len:2014 (-),score=552.22 TRINITY_DN4142_c0_g2_i1:163-6204(-)
MASYSVAGFKITAVIQERKRTVLLRATRNLDGSKVAIKLLKSPFLFSATEQSDFQRRFEIGSAFSSPFVTKYEEFINNPQCCAIVEEDDGAVPLEDCIPDGGFPLQVFLEIAVQVVQGLGYIHEKNLIHNDIRPGTILYNAATHRTRICNYEAVTLAREVATVSNLPEASLPYMSPEQTRRVDRTVDYRTDFYSLGVAFYQLLTGSVPFENKEAMSLIYAHLAVNPPLLSVVKPSIPEVLGNIVKRLMMKAPEERYQSAKGILWDLQKLQENPAEIFEIAQHDLVEKFIACQKIYGREAENQMMLSIYEHVSETSNPAVIAVGGYSGVGKSSLVSAFRQSLPTGTRFLSGKFDQVTKGIAYSAISQAFQDFIKQILGGMNSAIEEWARSFHGALGSNGQLIVELVPELEIIIGKQPDVPPLLDNVAARKRFELTFMKFFNVFIQKHQALVLWLDDWHWADPPTLELMKAMLTHIDTNKILFVVAYRDNEVDDNDPSMVVLKEIADAGTYVEHIMLSSLEYSTVQQWIADSLSSPKEPLEELTKLIFQKTEGNPFFVKTLLRALIEDGLVVLGSERWIWNADEISKMQTMANVADLLISKMQKLPNSTRAVLAIASCLGHRFKFDDLVMTTRREDTTEEMDRISNLGLIFQIHGDVHFAHDKVQEAAYSLLSDDAKKRTHLLIARLMLKNYPNEKFPEKLFDIVEHYNLGSSLIDDANEVEELVRLNSLACVRAKNAAAYNTALDFVNAALIHLDGTAWEKHYDTTLELHRKKAELEYMVGNFEACEKEVEDTLKRVRTDVEKAEIYIYLIVQKLMSSNPGEAVEIGMTALRLLGYNVSSSAQKEEGIAQMRVANASLAKLSSLESLLDKHEIEDRVKRIAFQIMIEVLPALYTTNHDLFVLFNALAVNLAVTYGHTPGVPWLYITYSSILCEDPSSAELGYKLALVALQLVDRYNQLHQICRAYHGFSIFISFWVRPLRESEANYEKAVTAGIESGEYLFASYARFGLSQALYHQGTNLQQLLPRVVQYMKFTEQVKATLATNTIHVVIFSIKQLIGEKSPVVNREPKFTVAMKNIDLYSLTVYNIFQSQVLYILGSFDQALVHSLEADKIPGITSAQFLSVEHIYYQALIMAERYATAAEGKREEYLTRIRKNQAVLKSWSEVNPDNFLQKYQIVAGEEARLRGNYWESADLFSQAIRQAKKSDFIQDEAIAKELAGKLYLAMGEEDLAAVRIRECSDAFFRWGAKAKVELLRSSHSNVLKESKSQSPLLPTAQASSVMMDMERVIAASQMISSDIDINKLLFSMMKVIIETAGAQKGALFLNHKGNLSVDAECTAGGEIHVLEESATEKWQGARTVVEYVKNTGRLVVLGRASDDKHFSLDPYISSHAVKSLLCMPITKQDSFEGLLYLENNLATFAFPQSRVTVLMILAGQMAISIENARLVQHRLEEQRRRAREAEKYKNNLEEFIDTICHEMRNPLNGIYGGATILNDQLNCIAERVKELTSEKDEKLSVLIKTASAQLDTINKCAQQQKVIVDDVLDLSRLQSNKIELNPVPFSVQTMITTVVQMLSPQISSNPNLELILDMPDEELWISADAHRLSQVLINLLSNSVKFTPQGYIEIAVNLTVEPKSMLNISLRDTGIGMTPEEKAGLFARFGQANRVISTEYGGSGLGLAISQKIIERMGGTISVESKKGFGTKFSLSVRCEIATKVQTEAVDESSVQLVQPSNVTLLIVEDNAVNQRLLLHYLQQKGYFCEVANNGQEALAKVETMQFDLIYMDIEMPVMGGLEATRRIRELEKEKKRTKVPIVGLSGNARSAQIDEAMTCGMDDYLTKPYHRDDIYKLAHKWTQNRIASPFPSAAIRREKSQQRSGTPKLQSLRQSRLAQSGSGSSKPLILSSLVTPPSPSTDAVHCFTAKIPNAQSVHIAGDFNNWLKNEGGEYDFDENGSACWYEMKKFDDHWKVNVPLERGKKYRFNYVVNRGERTAKEEDPKFVSEGDSDMSVVIGGET